jgi:hypothetical protein
MAQPHPFSAPAGGGDIAKPEDLRGHLLIVRPMDFRPGVSTSFGVTDAIAVDIADLSAADPSTGQPRVYKGALWFNVMLVNGLKTQIGEPVLGRMVQGLAKAGQSPPWQLESAIKDTQAVAAGQAWMAAHPEFMGMAAPAAPQQTAPTPTPYIPPVAPVAVPADVPALSFTPVLPAGVTPVDLTKADTPATTGPLQGIPPETLALIAQMQAANQLPAAVPAS